MQRAAAAFQYIGLSRCDVMSEFFGGALFTLMAPNPRARAREGRAEQRRRSAERPAIRATCDRTDLLEPPGRCSGCWPHDGEVDGCAVEISESGWGRRWCSGVRGER